jgi:hypothetical protein
MLDPFPYAPDKFIPPHATNNLDAPGWLFAVGIGLFGSLKTYVMSSGAARRSA